MLQSGAAAKGLTLKCLVVTESYIYLNKAGAKSYRFVSICMTFSYHQGMKRFISKKDMRDSFSLMT